MRFGFEGGPKDHVGPSDRLDVVVAVAVWAMEVVRHRRHGHPVDRSRRSLVDMLSC